MKNEETQMFRRFKNKVVRVSEEELQKIKTLHSQGYSVYSIAKHLNRNIDTIQRYINNNFEIKPVHLPYKNNMRYLTQEEKMKIKEMYEANFSIIKIADALGRNKSSIYSYLNKNIVNGEVKISEYKERRIIPIPELEHRIVKLETQIKILTNFIREKYEI